MKAFDTQTTLKKLQQRKELLVILLFLLVIVLLWITIGIFSSQQTPGITPAERRAAQPLAPFLDVTVIEKLEGKRVYDDSELGAFAVLTTPAGGGVPASTVAPESTGPQIILPDEIEGELQVIEQNF